MIAARRFHQAAQECDDGEIAALEHSGLALSARVAPALRRRQSRPRTWGYTGASPAEIAAARHAVAVAAVELTRVVDAMRLFEAGRATVRYFGRA